MERQQLELENQVEGLQQEINNLKANMTHLDQEKDQLLVSIRYNYIAKYSTTLTYDVMNKWILLDGIGREDRKDSYSRKRNSDERRTTNRKRATDSRSATQKSVSIVCIYKIWHILENLISYQKSNYYILKETP